MPSATCAPAMSITASGGPPAPTLPATRRSARAAAVCSCSVVAPAPMRLLGGGVEEHRGGIEHREAIGARARPRHQRRRQRARRPARRCRRCGSAPACRRHRTPRCRLRRPGWRPRFRGASRPRVQRFVEAAASGPTSSRSASPLAARTAAQNSPSADALIRCTENASATPSVTASSAAALRHGWWRSSGHDSSSSSDARPLMRRFRPA